jgi:hypothetical protein
MDSKKTTRIAVKTVSVNCSREFSQDYLKPTRIAFSAVMSKTTLKSVDYGRSPKGLA